MLCELTKFLLCECWAEVVERELWSRLAGCVMAACRGRTRGGTAGDGGSAKELEFSWP